VAGDLHRAAHGLDPVDQPDQPRPLGRVGSPDPVISNEQAKVVLFGVDANVHLGGSSVLGHVREGFGDDVVGGNFD
jgi:hypothetical protein